MIAWSRRFALASLALAAPLAHALDTIYTSSVSYCAPPSSLLIQQFDVAYFPSNSSISFNVSAASVMAVNVSANLFLNAYGMKPLNISLNLCHILDGVLCPLPEYNFVGADSITLPSTVDVASNLPGIAYTVPDLEAFAQLTLTDTSTGELVACVQSTLSNGLTTRQTAVEWATGGLAFFALASALWQSAVPDSLAPVRLLDLMHLYQTIASSGLLALNFPSVYRSFTLNFAWALGLFRSSSIQHSIDEMRARTGGSNVNGTSNAIGLVNRSLSPYNNIGALSTLSTYLAPKSLLARIKGMPVTNLRQPGLSLRNVARRALEDVEQLSSAGEVQNYSPSTDQVLEAGMPIYVNSLQIGTANGFMTIFFTALIFFAIAIGILGLTYGMVFAITRRQQVAGRLNEFKGQYPAFVRAWTLRAALICFTPVTIFAFYQWTLKDSWLSILFSVLLLLVIFAAIAVPVVTTVRLVRRSDSSALHTDKAHLSSNGPLHTPYRAARWYFFAPTLLAMLLRAMFIAFVQHGETQIILILVLETLLLGTTIALRPFITRGGDVFASYLAIVRVVCAGLMIAFIQSLGVKAIPRVVIGFVLIVILSIAVVVLFVNICCHVGLMALFRRRRTDDGARADAGVASMLEKAESPATAYGAPLPHTAGNRDGRGAGAPPDSPTSTFSAAHSFAPSSPPRSQERLRLTR